MQEKVRNPSRKSKWISRLFGLIIVVLIGAIGYELWAKPYVMGYMVRQSEVSVTPSHKAVDPNDKSITYGDSNTAISSLWELLEHRNGDGTLLARGTISVPVQDGVYTPINTTIFEGSSNYVLAYGAGTIKPDQKMGTGNYVIGAHNVADNTSLFSPLQTQIDVAKKPKAYLSDGKNVYTYQLNSWDRVSRTTHGLVADKENQKPKLTLITCYLEYPNFYDAQDRVVVTGDLVDVKSIN